MSLVPPTLLQRLSRSRLLVRGAVATGGVGERRSRARGPGIEFAEHREYQIGDDIRYLDPHVYARLGQHVLRSYSVDQQLQIAIVLDATASMERGAEIKAHRARQLAAILAYVGLAGGDAVQLAAFGQDGVRWHPRRSGTRRAGELFTFLQEVRFGGEADLEQVAREVADRLRPESLILFVSDFFLDGLDHAVSLWATRRHETVGVQVLTPEEIDPGLLGDDPVRLVDAETGAEAAITLDEPTLARYRGALSAWQARCASDLAAGGGRFVSTRTDEPLDRLVLTAWRKEGLVA